MRGEQHFEQYEVWSVIRKYQADKQAPPREIDDGEMHGWATWLCVFAGRHVLEITACCSLPAHRRNSPCSRDYSLLSQVEIAANSDKNAELQLRDVRICKWWQIIRYKTSIYKEHTLAYATILFRSGTEMASHVGLWYAWIADRARIRLVLDKTG